MNIHVLSSVHQYSDSPKFPKTANNVSSRLLSSSSSVNRFLKQRVFSTVFRLFYNWAVFLKIYAFCDVAETVCFFLVLFKK